jgi:hypothetical protein
MSYQLTAISLFVYFNGHVRADAPAKSAGSALTAIFKDDEVITFFVKLFRQPDALLRAGHDTELTALTAFLINRYLSHFSFPILKTVSVSVFRVS